MNSPPRYLSPPLPKNPQVKCIIFKFENGKEVFSTNLDIAKEIREIFMNSTNLEKKNAYFLVENRVVFLQHVTEIIWNLET